MTEQGADQLIQFFNPIFLFGWRKVTAGGWVTLLAERPLASHFLYISLQSAAKHLHEKPGPAGRCVG